MQRAMLIECKAARIIVTSGQVTVIQDSESITLSADDTADLASAMDAARHEVRAQLGSATASPTPGISVAQLAAMLGQAQWNVPQKLAAGLFGLYPRGLGNPFGGAR